MQVDNNLTLATDPEVSTPTKYQNPPLDTKPQVTSNSHTQNLSLKFILTVILPPPS